jgi:hypothetical protein
MNRVVLSVTLAALAGLALGACAPSAKREAASLVAAVDRYRQAEPAGKGSTAPAIAAVECKDADVCATKAACVAAADPTARGYALKAEVETSLADLQAGKITRDEATARELPRKLDDASRLLDQGQAALGDCDAKVIALRLKYGL